MAEKEEVLMEVEAVQAVYGEDCLVIETFPPHLHVYMKPRTADDSSQQFVEAVLEIRASPQYPSEPPDVDIIDSKGLDGERQKHLMTAIQDKVHELSSCLMLISICEEAVEVLCNMNHPDGNCPLCLYPLVPEDRPSDFLQFMKLMSCFHCFHCECIIRWWKWLQDQGSTNLNNLTDATSYSSRNLENRRDKHGLMRENIGNCPVCRKVFHVKDIKHVLDLVETDSSQLNLQNTDANMDEDFLQSETENIRRQKFEAVLKLQQENSGLIEPKKIDVLLPGVFLPEPISPPTVSSKATVEQHTDPSSTSAPGADSSGPSNSPSTSDRRNSRVRKNRARNTRKQLKQWIKKGSDTTG